MKSTRIRNRARSADQGAAAQPRAAERRLRELQRRYRTVMGAVNESVYDWDIARGRFSVSRNMQQLLGLPGEPLSLEAWQSRIHAEDYARFRAATIAHLKGATERFECDYRYRAADGEWRWARTHGVASRDRRGRAVRMIGSTGDVTQRKLQEIELQRARDEASEALEQLRASAEVLQAISGSIADTAPVFDKILESCQRLFAGTIVGLNLVQEDGMLHIGAYHGAHRGEFERIFPLPCTPESGSGLSIVERRVVHYPDAEHGPHVPESTRRGCRAIGIKSVIFAPVLWKERGLGAIFVGRDQVSSFSEREIALLRTFADQAAIAIENMRLFKEFEEKSAQLAAANRHKSEFLANMSHELRTPLNAIIGFARIVMRRAGPALEAKQHENLERILASGQHLLALINAILDLSKIEAGRVEVHPVEMALPPMLEQSLRTVEPLVRADAVELVREFDAALPSMYADEDKLRQIVINLLSNAAKFTAEGAIRLRARAADGAVEIAVADSGVGIPADKLELIFEEFEQLDASSTRANGGTGLGLAIARRLARLMGGDITAQSAHGVGSTFTLRLPLRYAA